MNTPTEGTPLTPAAKELAALILDYDLMQRGYMRDVIALRKQCTQHMQ